ncbi:hypothetical protein DMH17_02010 [Raoultella planticola]|nr:hypothetical protein [Raoultella planticola]
MPALAIFCSGEVFFLKNSARIMSETLHQKGLIAYSSLKEVAILFKVANDCLLIQIKSFYNESHKQRVIFCCSLFIKIFPSKKNNDENFIFNHWPRIQWRLQAENDLFYLSKPMLI